MIFPRECVEPIKRYVPSRRSDYQTLPYRVSRVFNKSSPAPSIRTGALQKCEDCRARPFEEIVTFHYTICLKPWMCLRQKQDRIQKRLCRRAHHEWFVYRSRMEQTWGRNGTGTGGYDRDHFMGYCSRAGEGGYQPIPLPYGNSLEDTEE
jgi:hypothetical protein